MDRCFTSIIFMTWIFHTVCELTERLQNGKRGDNKPWYFIRILKKNHPFPKQYHNGPVESSLGLSSEDLDFESYGNNFFWGGGVLFVSVYFLFPLARKRLFYWGLTKSRLVRAAMETSRFYNWSNECLLIVAAVKWLIYIADTA